MSVSDKTQQSLDRTRILALFERLGATLAAEGKLAEIAVYGGSALTLLFEFRSNTTDIDFLPVTDFDCLVEQKARELADQEGLDEGWLNHAVEVFVSDEPEYRLFGEFPSDVPGLRVFVASPEYIFSMKALSLRSSETSSDLWDIWNLAKCCGIISLDDAKDWMRRFFPRKPLPRRQELILSDIFSALERQEEFDPALGW